MSKIRCKIEAIFRINWYSFKNERFITVSITELIPEELTSLSSLERLRDDIQDWDILQEDLTGIDINALDEEKEYVGTFDVEINYWSTYDNWTGVEEWDSNISLDCKTYKEDTSEILTGLSHDRDYSKIFHATGNKDGDHIYMKLLPSGKIHIDFAHCCVRSRKHFVDVATLTACLSEHLHEYRTRKEDKE